MKKHLKLLSIILILITGCGRENLIIVSGSSTVYPITLEAQAKYIDKVDNELYMSVEANGTGAGFDLFSNNKTQINNASRKINKDEIKIAKRNNIKYDEYNIGTDGITVITNKENDWIHNIKSEDLKKAFKLGSNFEKWSDIDPKYPEQKINFYGPTSASGTYDFFVEAIIEDENSSLRDDINATENDNEVVSNVEKDKYGIGFLGYSYYESNKDKVSKISINNVAPNINTIKERKYILSRPLYIYVNNQSMKDNKDLEAFISYYIENSQIFVKLSGYIPLNDEEQKQLMKSLENNKK